MTFLESLAAMLGISMAIVPSFSGNIGLPTQSPWLYSGGTITISSTTAQLKIPGLTNCDSIDTNGSGVFTCGTDSAGSGSSFSTTSADYWKTQRDFFSTTSATYFADASTTIPKTYSANTFTVHNIFSSLFSTRASSTHATSTNLDVTGLFTFNGVTGSTWAAFCTAITGGSDLCDGSDAVGVGGTGLSTTTPVSDSNVLVYSSSGAGAAYGVATGTVSSANSALSVTSGRSVIGGALTLTVSTTTTTMFSGSGGSILAYSNALGGWFPQATSTMNVGTASALFANGSNCSAGNFPLGVDASGAVETCTDAWTEAENTAAAYAAQATTLTIAGTSNQITSSAGAQSLAANRTWTLSLPSLVIFPSNASSTLFSTTYGSTTDAVIGRNLTFGGITADTWPEFCETITGSTALCDGSDATGAGGSAAVATSTNETAGRLSYWTSNSGTPATLGEVATTTLTATLPLSLSQAVVKVGGSNSVLTISTTTDSLFAGSAGQILVRTSSGWTGGATTTFSGGLTYANGNVTADLGTSIDLASAEVTGDLPFANLTQIGANMVLANQTSATGDVAGVATSTLMGTGTGGQILAWLNGTPTWAASSTLSTITGTLSVAKGGTGLTTFGGTNTVLYTTAADTLASEAAFTYNASLNTLTAENASTTALTIGTHRQWDFGEVSFSYSSTTQGIGTTTKPVIRVMSKAGTFYEAVCHSNSFLRVLAQDEAGNRMDDLVASSTENTVTISTNTSFTAGEVIKFDVGTTTASLGTTYLGCTYRYRYAY